MSFEVWGAGGVGFERINVCYTINFILFPLLKYYLYFAAASHFI